MKMIAACLLTFFSLTAVAEDPPEEIDPEKTAPYEVTLSDDAFEIRHYPTLNVVSSADANDNGAFMRLFRYISKGNEEKQKIAMTTPVFTEIEDETQTMHFVLPASITEAPTPSSEKVQVGTLMGEGTTLATYRYSGRWTQENSDKAEAKLREWMKKKKLTSSGSALRASYNSPMTPPPMRRNEILIPIEQP